MIKIKKLQPSQVIHLIQALDSYHQRLYPASSNHLEAVSALEKHGAFLIGAVEQEEILGMGAFKRQEDYVEIKRLYVVPEARGRQIGAMIMDALEAAAQAEGYQVVRLETGIYQHSAIALYRKRGYIEIEPFGDYELDHFSLFMEKSVSIG